MAKDKALHSMVLTWLRRQCYVGRPEGACVRFEVNHVPPSGKVGAEIHRINVQDNLPAGVTQPDEPTTESFARDIVEEAREYAEGMGERQSFTITAFFEEDPDKGIARKAFTVGPDSTMDMDSLTVAASEPANLAGIVKSLLRHNEAMMRVMVSSFGTTLTAQGRQIDRLSTMNEKLLEGAAEGMEVMEELHSKHHERALAMKREEASQEAKAKMVESAIALLPAVANKLVGKRVLPETQDITLMQVVKLAEALTPQEMEGILGAINDPALKIAFVQMLQTVQQRTEGEGANGVGKAAS